MGRPKAARQLANLQLLAMCVQETIYLQERPARMRLGPLGTCCAFWHGRMVQKGNTGIKQKHVFGNFATQKDAAAFTYCAGA